MTSNLFGRCLLLLAALGIPASAQLTYQINTTPPTLLSAGGAVTFPTTVVGNQSSLVIQVTNSGTANATVNTINTTGAAFQANAPTLPATLAPNGILTFIVTFAPVQAGTANGSLAIDAVDFLLSGTGLASPLVFSYVTAGTTITLGATNSSVVFSPVPIGQTTQLVFDVRNAGTSTVVVSNIGIGQAPSPFSVGLPQLPIALAAGADFHFTIAFHPAALGFSNGTLLIDTASLALIGSGTTPPALPSYTIGGVSGQVAPRSQPKISLTLSNTYPVALAGTLTLATSGNLPNDPAVQFASGGQTVSFVIPANSTSAIFNGSGTTIGFQTGTVASTITFTPSFATQASQVDLTPQPPQTLQVNVAVAIPTLIGIQLTNETASGFSIVVTGFTTTRTLTNWTVQIATVSGFTMAQSQFTLNIQAPTNVWFQSTGSQAFGGQFTITVPFTFSTQATLPSGASVLSALASVSVNMSNELGTSNTVQAALQ